MTASRGTGIRPVRRVLFLLALAGLALTPAAVVPAVVDSDEDSIWPFSLVPESSWRRLAPSAADAGYVVPVSFRLGKYRGLDILRPEPTSIRIDCDAGHVTGNETAFVRARGVLSYDAYTESYTFWWPQSEEWRGTCRRLLLGLDDGSSRTVVVRFGDPSVTLAP